MTSHTPCRFLAAGAAFKITEVHGAEIVANNGGLYNIEAQMPEPHPDHKTRHRRFSRYFSVDFSFSDFVAPNYTGFRRRVDECRPVRETGSQGGALPFFSSAFLRGEWGLHSPIPPFIRPMFLPIHHQFR